MKQASGALLYFKYRIFFRNTGKDGRKNFKGAPCYKDYKVFALLSNYKIYLK